MFNNITNNDIFQDITNNHTKNTHLEPIFLIDVSGSTSSHLDSYDKKSMTIMDYEFEILLEIAEKNNYTNGHIIIWSSSALSIENAELTRQNIIHIKEQAEDYQKCTYLLSGFNEIKDNMYSNDELTEIYIITDGEIQDNSSDIATKFKQICNNNVCINIIAVERGNKDYMNTDCNVGNTFFNIVQNNNMTRYINRFSIYNNLRTEFVNFVNPSVPDNYIPFGYDKMFERILFSKFIVHVDKILADVLIVITTNSNESDKPNIKYARSEIMKFTHMLALTIYHSIKNMSYGEQMNIIELFCNMYKRFNTLDDIVNIYADVRELLINEVNNHISGKATTFTSAKKARHLEIENTNLDLMDNVRKAIGINTNNNMISFLIKNNNKGLILNINSYTTLDKLYLDKICYGESCVKLGSYSVPVMFTPDNKTPNTVNSVIQWSRIMYARALNLSPSNPYIYYYLAADAFIVNLADNISDDIKTTYNTYVNLFLDEEVFNKEHKLIETIIYNQKVNINYNVIKGAQLFTTSDIYPLSLFYLICVKYLLPRFTNNDDDNKTNFIVWLRNMCKSQISLDLTNTADMIDITDTINATFITNDTNDIDDWNDVENKLISKIKQTLDIRVIDYTEHDILIKNEHYINGTAILCPKTVSKISHDTNSISLTDHSCNICGSEIENEIITKTNLDANILTTCHNAHFKNIIIDNTKSIDLGMLKKTLTLN